VITYHGSIPLDGLDLEIPELERIVRFHVPVFLSGVVSRPYCGVSSPRRAMSRSPRTAQPPNP
jgi:hypothetical protein